MKTRSITFVTAVASLVATSALSHDFQGGSIRIDHPWSRATPPGAPVAGGYLKIENAGAEPDRLVSVTSEIAASTELHESVVKDGVASMRPADGPLEVPAGQTVEVGAGNHIMFLKPVRTLKTGEEFKATLVFEKAGPIEVVFVVQGMGSRAPEGGSEHGAGHAAGQ